MSKSTRNSSSNKENTPKTKASPIRSFRTSSKPPLVSNTPNFGRVQAEPNPSEDSLNLSLIPLKSRPSDPQSPILLPEMPVSSFVSKYDRAFSILNTSLQKYQQETDSQILTLHEDLASIKNSMKIQQKHKQSLVKNFEKSLQNCRLSLDEYFKSVYHSISPSKYSKENISALQSLHKDYDQKLLENENYLKSFDSSKRSKSSIRSYFSCLAEENKRLREDLSKMWNKPN